MAIAFLATIAAQMGSAWINSSRSKSHSKKMAELQRAYEEKAAKEGIENARAEFAELCSFQREMEKQTHKDRLELIKNNHEQTLYQVAYERSLHKWPLLVPPYVIANAPLTIGSSMEQRIPLNCILTTSSNLSFNRHVFPKIEEQIAIFCSKYWNISANKSIRFFQEAWKDTANDVGSLHKDIYAHLKNVPTLLISPVLKNETILFRFYWWGLSLDPTDAHVDELNELNPELSISITSDTKFDGEISNLIVKGCVPKLEAFISFFADLYYWNYYKEPPLLTALLQSGVIALTQSETKDYVNEYGKLLAEYIDKSKYSTLNSRLVLETVSSLSSYNDSEILNQILSTVISNKEFLYTSDLPVVKGLSKIKSSLSHELSEIALNLEKGEAITVHPFSSTKEMFYNTRNIFDFPTSKDKELHLKFINEYAFICSVVDNSRTNLYSSLNSRFHLFITYNKIPLSIYEAGVLNTANQNFTKIDPESSPCSQLVYDGDNIIRIIRQVRDFLLESQGLFNQISSGVSPSGVDSTTSLTTTYDDIKRWISTNRRGEKEFRLLLSYNTHKQYYMIVGRFVDGDDIVEDRTYVSHFSFLDDSIKRLLNYNCVIKLNIN